MVDCGLRENLRNSAWRSVVFEQFFALAGAVAQENASHSKYRNVRAFQVVG
jgi:hypothetical protein